MYFSEGKRKQKPNDWVSIERQPNLHVSLQACMPPSNLNLIQLYPVMNPNPNPHIGVNTATLTLILCNAVTCTTHNIFAAFGNTLLIFFVKNMELSTILM